MTDFHSVFNAAFLSTPSARRATDGHCAAIMMQLISIHALCEEGDGSATAEYQRQVDISIHALCEEGDTGFLILRTIKAKFLSTPSARRATAKTEKNISAFVSL